MEITRVNYNDRTLFDGDFNSMYMYMYMYMYIYIYVYVYLEVAELYGLW
jgi:hypothetical protein